MKSILIIIIFLFSMKNAYSQNWMLIDYHSSSQDFVDVSSFTIKNDILTATLKRNYEIPQTATNGAIYLSSEFERKINCLNGRNSIEGGIYYSEKDLRGSRVDVGSKKTKDFWFSPNPYSEVIQKMGCPIGISKQ